MNKFEKLPFKNVAEKIPLSDKAIANKIACGLAVVLVMVVIAACSGKGKESPVSDFSYDVSSDGTGIKITGYTGKGGAVVIPGKIEDLPVVEIGAGAFEGEAMSTKVPKNCDAITSIVVPDSVVTIGAGAFNYIDNLTSATLPDGLKIIQTNLFRSCLKLTTVNLPASIEVIGPYAFAYCDELSNLTIPDSLGSVTFWNANGNHGDNNAFLTLDNDGKLSIATRQKLRGLSYTGSF
jgi:hypothetical protein